MKTKSAKQNGPHCRRQKNRGRRINPPAPAASRERVPQKPCADASAISFGSASRRATSSTEEPIIANRGRSLASPMEKPPPFAQFQGLSETRRRPNEFPPNKIPNPPFRCKCKIQQKNSCIQRPVLVSYVPFLFWGYSSVGRASQWH